MLVSFWRQKALVRQAHRHYQGNSLHTCDVRGTKQCQVCLADIFHVLSGTNSLPTIRKTCSEEKKRSSAEQRSVTGTDTLVAMGQTAYWHQCTISNFVTFVCFTPIANVWESCCNVGCMDHFTCGFLWLVMISLDLYHMCHIESPGEACVESMKLSNTLCASAEQTQSRLMRNYIKILTTQITI